MAAEWNPEGWTQEDFMLKDECILVSHEDKVLGPLNKKQTHVFDTETPRGSLHRAFSVFLFNEEGKLLLQQRAADKITFPNVWTNTCCSHPLFGLEVDTDENILNGTVPGAKTAAVRKLYHELGIPPSEINVDDFKFLTRLHYWAADVVTHGPNSPWGENEVDYILFAQKKNVTINLNPEEIRDAKYVSLPELQAMMDPSLGLLWSPWFRIIATQFLPHWWADLNKTLTTDKFVETDKIYRFDPTEEHMGGGGNARNWLGAASYSLTKDSPDFPNAPPPTTVAVSSPPAPEKEKVKVEAGQQTDKGLKQGAYGKVQIHKHSKFDQISRIDEVFSALYYLYGPQMENKLDLSNENVQFCDDILGKVSRSFASVIRQLPKGLCMDIMIFYLALRALDTIEDDMQAFKGREAEKIRHLNTFYQTGLQDDHYYLVDVGEGDEKRLLAEFFRCVSVYKSLRPESQEVIADITRRMGEGMAQYVEKDLGQGTTTIQDYNLYCHYVAGLVGEGLSRLFSASQYESPQVAMVSTTLADTMGLFLQKTNIIRDYLEDYVDGRAFWPQEVWKKYTKTDLGLGELARPEALHSVSLPCLNHLVTDALTCIPQCLEYMTMLRNPEVFRFCAIPQVMAIATLAELYNNPKVFTGVVKIRKGQACKLVLDSQSEGSLHKWFYLSTQDILKKIPASDPNAAQTREICLEVIRLTEKKAKQDISLSYKKVFARTLAPSMLFVSGMWLFNVRGWENAKSDFKRIMNGDFGPKCGVISTSPFKFQFPCPVPSGSAFAALGLAYSIVYMALNGGKK